MTRRRWVLLGAAIALAIVLAVVLWPDELDDEPRPAAPTARRGGSVRLADGTGSADTRPTPSGGKRDLPPPPPDFDPGSTPPTPGGDPRLVEALEGARRAGVYRQRFPSDTLPNEDETRRLLEEVYVDERHQRWFERWQDFTAAYGEPPMGVFSYGGDPAYGAGEPPPPMTAGPPLVPDTTRPTSEDDGTRTPMQPAGPR